VSAVAAERLPGVLGHELRNPLASAMTGVMLAREMIDADDPRGAVLDGALRDLDRMTRLIDGWLRLARTGTAQNGVVVVDELLEAVARRHGAEFVARCADAVVKGDRSLLERALDNLLENARQAGARHLRLAVQCLADEVVIHVEDDGHGVAPEHLERLFTPGWSGRGGNGLGLYAVATTIAAHQGRVRCVPLPRGTRFTVSLPMAAGRHVLA
jgi:signal transduction histidine kinase